jgi:hypothetical protein
MSSVNNLTSFEWGLAAYVASVINDDTSRAEELERRLTNLGASSILLENIRAARAGGPYPTTIAPT